MSKVNSFYLKVTNNKKVLTFDSGEKSVRNYLVKKVASHLLSQGHKVVIFAQINPDKTTAYFRLLPSTITNEVLSLGSYYRYISFVKNVRQVLQESYYDTKFSKVMIVLLAALREALADCIQQLLNKGYYILLDRSYYSTLAYQYYAMLNNKDSAIELAQEFNPGVSIFVTENSTESRNNKLYSEWTILDQKVKSWLRTIYELKKAKGHFVYLYDGRNSLEELLSSIYAQLANDEL